MIMIMSMIVIVVWILLALKAIFVISTCNSLVEGTVY